MTTDDRDTQISPPLEAEERRTLPPPPPDAPPTPEAMMQELRYGNSLTLKSLGQQARLFQEQSRIHARLDDSLDDADNLGGRVLSLEQTVCAIGKALETATASDPADSDEMASFKRRFLPVIQVASRPCGPVQRALSTKG